MHLSLSMFLRACLTGIVVCVLAAAQPTALTYNAGSSVKIEQVIGDCDYQAQARQIVAGQTVTCAPTTSQTVSRFDVAGNGQGGAFEAGNKMIFFFGDTISSDPSTLNYGGADPIAWSTSTDPEAGLLLQFYMQANGKPLFVKPPGIAMGGDDIPNSGIDLNGQIYFIVNTGSDTTAANPQASDYSVLVSFNEAAQTFTGGRTISPAGGRFIGTSVHACGSNVCIFGAGPYRASDIFLQMVPANSFATGTGTQYFAGVVNGQPTWAASEAGAVPVVQDDPAKGPAWPMDNPSVGNMSVVYSSAAGMWLMTYDGGRNTSTPGKTRGVYFTYAQQPWGPWAAPQLIFNDARDSAYGLGGYIHDPGVLPDPPGDGLNGPMIGSNNIYTSSGGGFAPQLIERFVTVTGNTLKIYYNLSTWNPYVVVRIRSEFTITGCQYSLSQGGQAFTSSGGIGSVAINTAPGCPWSVTDLPAGVTISGVSSGVGNGNVTFQVSAAAGSDATSSFTIAGQTFAVEQEGSAVTGLAFAGSLPHLAAEGGWETTFTLVNKGASSAIARASLFAPGGPPLPLPLNLPDQPSIAGSLVASSLDQTLAPNAIFTARATGPANVAYLEGSAQLAATGSVDGFEIFHFDPSAQEAVVPLETRTAPSFLLAFDDTNTVVTGVAVGNVSPQNANIGVIIRDDTGKTIGTGSVSLNGNGHTSFLLPAQFPVTANIRGTVEFDTPPGGQISALGIRFTPPGTLTTIPTLANVSATGGLISHLASGAGWETTFVLVNAGASAAQARLSFFGDSGSALSLPLTFPQSNGGVPATQSTLAQTIAPGASLWVQSTGAVNSALLTGSAQLTSTGNIGGFVIFRYNPNGQEAVVPLESRNAAAYMLAFDNTGGLVTGLAVSSVSAQAASIPVILRDGTGAQIGTGAINLPANGHYSQLLATSFPATAGTRGTVEFDAPAGVQIGVVGIRSSPALTFTTLPPLAR